jgi:hypothetical protein
MSSSARLRVAPALHGRRSLDARRRGPDRIVWPGLAAEHGGAYHAVPPPDEVDGPHRRDEGRDAGVPFGLPVLAELPELAQVLERLAVADDALLDAVAGLADLLARGRVETVTGVGVEHWLSIVAGLTRMDRRLLVRACRLLGRFPALDAAVRAHRLSFAQLRGLTIALRAAPRRLDDQVDAVVGSLLDGLDRLERPDPDVLVRQVSDALDELDADDLAAREQGATAGRFLQLQPRLDGTGGRISGELDAAGLALLDAVTTPTAAQAARAGGHAAARADLLLTRLAGTTRSDAAGDTGSSDDTGTAGDADPHGWFADLAPPQLLLRLPFDTLLDDRVPADLLTTLVGGRLRLTSPAARRLLETAGARLRTIVVDDDGTVIGVGRTTRQPPGFLRDAIAALHDTCTGPGCQMPARGAQIDHAAPWWPSRPEQAPGTTDLDNLGPLCATTNRAREAAGWQLTQTIAGTRTWTHARTGLTTTTVPTTWRPADDPRRRRRPPRPEPPGHHGTGPVEPDRTPEPPPPDAPALLSHAAPGDGLPF